MDFLHFLLLGPLMRFPVLPEGVLWRGQDFYHVSVSGPSLCTSGRTEAKTLLGNSHASAEVSLIGQ